MAPKTAREQLGVDLPEPQVPVQAADPPAAVEEQERPEWLPEKFKDEADFAKSYNELENELRQRGESQKVLEQQVQSLTALVENFPQQQQTQQPQQQQGFNEQLMAAYENDPLGTIIYLSQQSAAQQLQAMQQQNAPETSTQRQLQGEMVGVMAERQLETVYDDWKEYAGRVGEAIQKDPRLMPNETLLSVEDTSRRLEQIYKQVKYDDLTEQLKNGQSSLDQTRMKQQAQTIGGNAGRPGEPSPTDAKIEALKAAAQSSSYSAWRGGS